MRIKAKYLKDSGSIKAGEERNLLSGEAVRLKKEGIVDFKTKNTSVPAPKDYVFEAESEESNDLDEEFPAKEAVNVDKMKKAQLLELAYEKGITLSGEETVNDLRKLLK